MSQLHAASAYEAMTEALRAEGYSPGPPPHLSKSAENIDRDLCEESQCDQCGRCLMAYRAWHRGMSYRALCVCLRCAHCFEF